MKNFKVRRPETDKVAELSYSFSASLGELSSIVFELVSIKYAKSINQDFDNLAPHKVDFMNEVIQAWENYKEKVAFQKEGKNLIASSDILSEIYKKSNKSNIDEINAEILKKFTVQPNVIKSVTLTKAEVENFLYIGPNDLPFENGPLHFAESNLARPETQI